MSRKQILPTLGLGIVALAILAFKGPQANASETAELTFQAQQQAACEEVEEVCPDTGHRYCALVHDTTASGKTVHYICYKP